MVEGTKKIKRKISRARQQIFGLLTKSLMSTNLAESD